MSVPSPSAGRERVRSGRAWLAVYHGDAGAPLEVGDERGAKVGVGGQPDLVGGGDHPSHPALPLLLGELTVAVLGEHVLVAAVVVGIELRSAEGLGEPRRDVLGVVGIHPAEDRFEQRVGFGVDRLVEPRGESFQRLDPADHS